MANSHRSPLGPVFALGCALLVATACQSTEFTYLDVAEPDVADDVAPGDTTGEVDAGPAQSLSGGPCEVNKDCFTGGTCFSTEFLNKMLDPGDASPDVPIPGGMCSKLACGSHEQCGEGGKCFDASALAGNALTLCGWPCETYGDCRWREGYLCYYTGKPDEIKVCLPTELVAIIECGNGTCDSYPEKNYVETKDSCPRDCQ